MKRILITALVCLVSFAAGLVGVYFALPSLAPERVSSAKSQIDSLNVSSSDSTNVIKKLDFSSSDSTAVTSRRHEWSDSTDVQVIQEETPSRKRASIILSDTLNYLAESLQATRVENASLRKQIEQLEKQIKNFQTNQIEAGNLSETLTKLEDKELSAVVQQLDMETVTMLYQQASPRNRTRLLQAMPAERAALFVRSLIQPGGEVKASKSQQTGKNDEVSSDETSG